MVSLSATDERRAPTKATAAVETAGLKETRQTEESVGGSCQGNARAKPLTRLMDV